ncbi:Serine threonine- kinase N2 [Pelobates cultripes]|uniref:Serine threonine- kinase N2 n=1 Tax=Pelobates cultripes TaxID=61616 RepID=A0AAD1SFJ1_PELCU|nr:Serine threonine- kinase N2 [Pelobates cultripes]
MGRPHSLSSSDPLPLPIAAHSADADHVSETQVNDIIKQGAGEHPATPAISTLEKRIEELSHRFVIERAVAEGAKRTIKALDHGKPLVQAQSILNQANEKLDLLKYSMEELVKELPDSHPRKSITTEELFLNSDISKPTALTDEVRAQLKIDHIPVGSTSWKTVSKQSWNETFKLELNKSRELELSLYWHDRRSLCATKMLKLEEFLVNRKQELCLQLEPQGTLFIKVTFSNASIQKRPKLQTIQKFFSKKQEETFQPTTEEDTSIDILPVPVSDTESVVPSPPAVDTDAEETIKSTSEEDITSDVLPLPVSDTESVVPALPAVDTDNEVIIQSTSEEDIVFGSIPLPVSDKESVVSSPPAINTDTEETIHSVSKEDIISGSLPLPVFDTESVESSPPTDNTDSQEASQSMSEDGAIDLLPLPVFNTGSQESSWSISVSPVVSSDTESEPEESPVAHHTSFCSDQPGLHVIIPDILSQDYGAGQDNSMDYTSNQVPCNTPQHDGRHSPRSTTEPRGFPMSLCAGQRTLWKGGFRVLLVDHKRTNTTFALKVQKKRKIIASNSIDCLKYEKNIFQTISRIRHPFLVNLFASFQTEDLVCFVMEYAAGGDLMSTLNNNMAAFTESRAMFYAACCVLGLEFLHQNKIAHRDLKLRNIVVDKDGYAKITDFGLSKQGKDRETEISYKVVNTEPDYPEFLSLEALSIIKSGVDWSALLFKNIINPFVPSIAGPEDVSHFDKAFTTLDPILTPPEESPLEDQDLFQDFDWVADWI